MFQALQPLVKERSVHVLISAAADGRLSVYVEPIKKNDAEEDAFVTPFRAQATPLELDEQFSTVLTQWIASRQLSNTTLEQQLAEANAVAKAAADEAKKKAADKGKKPTTVVPPTSKPVVKVENKPMTPSLLDAPVAAATPSVKATPTLAPTPPVAAQVTEVVQTAPVIVEAAAAPIVAAAPVAPVIEAIVAAPAPEVIAAPAQEVVVESAPAAPVVPVASISTETGTPDLWG